MYNLIETVGKMEGENCGSARVTALTASSLAPPSRPLPLEVVMMDLRGDCASSLYASRTTAPILVQLRPARSYRGESRRLQLVSSYMGSMLLVRLTLHLEPWTNLCKLDLFWWDLDEDVMSTAGLVALVTITEDLT